MGDNVVLFAYEVIIDAGKVVVKKFNACIQNICKDKRLLFPQHTNFNRRFSGYAVIVTVIAKFDHGYVTDLLQAFHIVSRYAVEPADFRQCLLGKIFASLFAVKA